MPGGRFPQPQEPSSPDPERKISSASSKRKFPYGSFERKIASLRLSSGIFSASSKSSHAIHPKRKLSIDWSQSKIIKRTCPRENPRVKDSHRRIISERFQATVSKRTFPSEKSKTFLERQFLSNNLLAKDPNPKQANQHVPSQSFQVKVPNRKFPNDSAQANAP